MKRQHLYRVLQVTLFVLAIWLVWRGLRPELARISLSDVARWRPAPVLLLVSTVGLTLLHLAQAVLWRKVVVDVGSPRPSLRTTIRVYFVSGFARFIPGSLWQFAGMAVLGQQAGIQPLAAAAAGAIGNIIFLATGIVFLAFTLPGIPEIAGLLAGLLAAAAAVFGVFIFTSTAAGARLRARALAHAPRKLVPALEMAGRIRPSHALAWTVGYGGCWLLLGASFALFVVAFVPAAAGHARELGGIMAASYILGYVAIFFPAGLGPRELTMFALLTGIVPASAAILIPIAARVWFFAAELLAFGTFPLMPGRSGGDDGGPNGRPETRQDLLEVL